MSDKPTMPSEVTAHVGLFDRFAGAASNVVARPFFFTACVLLVVLWAPSFVVLRDLDTWQLVINTTTTIVTFLMVALLENSSTRADQAVQHKLNAIAKALAAQMEGDDAEELRAAIGLEDRESTS